MVGFTELRQVRTAALHGAGQAWWDHAAALRDLTRRMNEDAAAALVRGGWTGEAAAVAVERGGRIEEGLEIRSYEAELVAAAYDAAYDRLWRLQWRLTVAVDTAVAEGFPVRADGVVETPVPQPWEFDLDGGGYLARRAQRARDLTDEIAGYVAEADAIDERTARALATLSPEHQPGLRGWQDLSADARALAAGWVSADDVPLGADPAAVAAWWEGLSPAQQAMYAAAHPVLIGGLDGLPVETRDRANQLALRNTAISPHTDQRSRDRAQAVLDQVEASGHRPPAQHMYLIDYDLTADGRAVISVGNPDTADHTAVWVPGISNTIDDIGPDLQRVRNLQERADQLTDPATGDVATVMWLGYDTPGGPDPGAMTGGDAEAGASHLDRFIDGLHASHESGSGRMTVVGHSYGSTLVGEAASGGDGLAVDDIVVAGSPGMRVDGAAGLQVDPGHVWAGAAAGDHVSGWMSHFVHGPEPHREQFGGNRFEVDTTGHSDYWTWDTESLDNQANIVVGAYQNVGLEHGERPGRPR